MLPLLTGTKVLVGARALQVDGFRDEFLSGAALALNQDRAAARGNLRNEVEHLQNLFALSDDVAVTEAFFQRPAQLQVFAHQLPLLDRVPHDDDEFLVVPGLRDVVEGSFFDRGDGRFERSNGRDDDDWKRRIDPS